MTLLTTQLSLFMKNIPGTLHQVLRAIRDAEINIEAIMVNEGADHSIVRLVVDHPAKAIHLLGDRGLLVVESEVIAHEVANRPGVLMEIAGSLARGKINISYLYASAPAGDCPARVFLSTDGDKKAIGLLRGGAGRNAKGKGPKARRAGRKRG